VLDNHIAILTIIVYWSSYCHHFYRTSPIL